MCSNHIVIMYNIICFYSGVHGTRTEHYYDYLQRRRRKSATRAVQGPKTK